MPLWIGCFSQHIYNNTRPDPIFGQWGMVSSAVAAVLWVGVVFDLMKASTQTLIVMMVVVVGSFAADAVHKSLSITKRYRPRQQELESLRNKLTEPQR